MVINERKTQVQIKAAIAVSDCRGLNPADNQSLELPCSFTLGALAGRKCKAIKYDIIMRHFPYKRVSGYFTG